MPADEVPLFETNSMHLCFFAVPESGELVGSICFLLSTTWISASELVESHNTQFLVFPCEVTTQIYSAKIKTQGRILSCVQNRCSIFSLFIFICLSIYLHLLLLVLLVFHLNIIVMFSLVIYLEVRF